MAQAQTELATAFHQMAGQMQLAKGMAIRVASDHRVVTEAWRTVYYAYRRTDLIGANPHRVYTALEALGPQTAVICGCVGPLVVSTLTATADSDAGLRLDHVYPEQLQTLRESGRRLMEVGLFADRRKNFERSTESLFFLSHYAFQYGIYQNSTDVLIGVHPRHANFYIRSLGFESFGSPRPHSNMNDQPVTLLRGNLQKQPEQCHAVQEYFRSKPVPVEQYEQRFCFEPQQLEGSPILSFVQESRESGKGEKAERQKD